MYAATARGLFFGNGWVTATERLWQADLVRRTATGTLSALIGAGDAGGNVQSDQFFRGYTGGTSGLTRLVAKMDPSTRLGVDAFVAGMNARIADAERNAALPLEYAAAHAKPEHWTAQDVVATGMLAVFQVGTAGRNELTNAQILQDLVARLGPAAAAKAFADTHWLDDPTAPTTIPSRSARIQPAGPATVLGDIRVTGDAASKARARLAAALARTQAVGFGGPGHSNAIALSGRLARSGQPLLLAGPQIGYTAPQGFLELGLHGAGYDATGVTLTGIPGVLIGAGSDSAWTVTSAGDDNQDLYVETVDPGSHPGKYLFNGTWRPYQCRTETIAVAGADPVTLPACESVHGPVLAKSGMSAVALRDATRDRFPSTLRGFFGINRARAFTEFLRSARDVGASLNFTYADGKGHIAFARVGPVPLRAAPDNRFLPHAGDGSAEWLGFLSSRRMPLAVNPRQGWLANWNNKPEPGWQNSSGGLFQWGPVQRVQAITRQLEDLAPGTATLATLERVNRTAGQTADTPAGHPRVVVVPALLAPMVAQVDLDADARLAAVLARLRGWTQQHVDRDGNGAYDNPAVTVFTAWYSALVDRVVVPALGAPFAVGGPEEDTTDDIVSRILAGDRATVPLQYDYLAGTSLPTAVTNSLIEALDALTARYGTADVSQWLTPDPKISWKPLGAGRVPDTPWMNRGTYNQILSLNKAGPRGENVLPPGVSGDPRSPHFADQLTLYATWQYKHMRISKADVTAHATSVEVLNPV